MNICARLDLRTAHSILARCTGLRSGTLEDIAPSIRDHGVLAVAILPKLRVLKILSSVNRNESACRFFRFLKFPNLRHLDVDSENWPVPAFLSIQERSKFALTHLSLRYVQQDAADIVLFLEGNPTVEELCLADFKDQGIVTALTY
ncbi:hypothetical protein C8R43DRAFT_954861 [Mycena crocata]|nr:hypothetical protein C8R43DRAFT_954861 [Mycena crocata]